MSLELLAALATPTVVVGFIGWLMRRSIGQLDTAILALQAEVKALSATIAHRDVEVAKLEGRILALERELFTRR
jgi:hypothetical protein